MRKPVVIRPVSIQFPVTQSYGEDSSYHTQRSKFYLLFNNKHPGIDFGVPIKTKVFCAFPGIIVRREIHQGMGKVAGIRNGNIVALYAHLSSFCVKLGQIVKTGDLVGLSGNTGLATTEPHLHFELRDITKQKLKDMVFRPLFSKSIVRWRPQFEYVVNNQNTKKTLRFLSFRYFGSREYWKSIQKHNPTMSKFKQNDLIPEGSIIVIPNYQ